MDRRAKKLEKKRKRRDEKKKNTAILARDRSSPALPARTAARGEFGPCFVSAGWDDLHSPALVTVLVTRKLTAGLLVAGIALVDRTCLGVKNGYRREPMLPRQLAEFADAVGTAHGGLLPCEPLVAQSVVFHAIDYARSLGFEPHPDFPAALFGPRPAELSQTPWSAAERPIYISGPNDNVPAVLNRLAKATGSTEFDLAEAWSDDEEHDFMEEDDSDDMRLGVRGA